MMIDKLKNFYENCICKITLSTANLVEKLITGLVKLNGLDPNSDPRKLKAEKLKNQLESILNNSIPKNMPRKILPVNFSYYKGNGAYYNSRDVVLDNAKGVVPDISSIVDKSNETDNSYSLEEDIELDEKIVKEISEKLEKFINKKPLQTDNSYEEKTIPTPTLTKKNKSFKKSSKKINKKVVKKPVKKTKKK